jgi:hypothetical protein
VTRAYISKELERRRGPFETRGNELGELVDDRRERRHDRKGRSVKTSLRGWYCAARGATHFMRSLVARLLIRRTFVMLQQMGTRHLHLLNPCLGARFRANAPRAAMANHCSNALHWQQHCQEPDNEKLAPGLHGSREMK